MMTSKSSHRGLLACGTVVLLLTTTHQLYWILEHLHSRWLLSLPESSGLQLALVLLAAGASRGSSRMLWLGAFVASLIVFQAQPNQGWNPLSGTATWLWHAALVLV